MQITMREALKLAIRDEMASDPTVVVFGEDVAEAGGVFKVTAGLFGEFGPDRVRDTPIAETAILGAAIGAAARGLRPVVEIMFVEFFGVALDQVVTEAAKMRYLSGGKVRLPMVVRASAGGGLGFGAQHSQTLESWFMNTPGLTVVSPSGPASAYALLRAAIRSDDPVIFLEPRNLYGVKEDFEPSAVRWRLGEAQIAHKGSDVTIVSLGQMVRVALAAADQIRDTVSCEVIDLGTVRPWDRATVLASVARSRRLVLVEENPLTGGWGTDVASVVAAECQASLVAPITRVTSPDVPVPFGALERAYLTSAEDVAAAVSHLFKTGTLPQPRWAGWARSRPSQSRESGDEPRRRAELAEPLGRYDRMLEIRLVEDEAMSLFHEGLISGTMHTCQGQEAVAVGIAAVLRPTDTVTCTYRGHGHALALGLTPLAVLAELLGRRDGVLEGKGGSMHLVAPNVGLLPTFAIVGAGIPISAGAAYASQVLRDDAVAAAIFGDGAANIGAFHEGLNLAAIWRLPAIFICENNLYGEYSRIDKTTPVRDIASRADAYAIPGVIVDGQDLDAVIAAVRAAAERARTGGGPTLLEMKTYRFAGHSRGDPATYRPAAELEQWKTRDPIALYERTLIASHVADEARLAAIRKTVGERVAGAVAAARASLPPEVGAIMENVTAD